MPLAYVHHQVQQPSHVTRKKTTLNGVSVLSAVLLSESQPEKGAGLCVPPSLSPSACLQCGALALAVGSRYNSASPPGSMALYV